MKSFDSTTGESTWITPPELQKTLGEFDLDPCAADDMPYWTATRMVTKSEDGLKVDWTGERVWLNPPYGRFIVPFLERMHKGIALLPVRTDCKWFHELVAKRADALFFLKGRVRFIDKNGRKAGSPAFASMLVSYTAEDTEAIRKSGLLGVLFKGACGCPRTSAAERRVPGPARERHGLRARSPG